MKTIHIVEETLPEAFEEAVTRCWNEGEDFPTEYDQKERGDPPSKDCTMLVHLKNPGREKDRNIHRGLCMGLEDMEKYRNEVIVGCHDHWVDPSVGKWEYTYHQRLFAYDVPGRAPINQIEACITKLKQCGFTRRVQAITWQPWNDIGIDDPSCLQSLWFRVQDGKLNMNVRIRSNDLYKAFYPNVHVMLGLQEYVANEVGVEMGELIWLADSMHIYGSYFEEMDGFFKTLKNRTFEERLYDFNFCVPMFIEGCDTLLAEEDMPYDKKKEVLQRKQWLQNQL